MPEWEPTDADVRAVIRNQNPWLSRRAVPTELAPPRRRGLAKQLWRDLQRDEVRRFQVVLGPRRVGKTTAMYQTVDTLLEQGIPAARLWWFRLDHVFLMRQTLHGLLDRLVQFYNPSDDAPLYVFLDELTYASDWDRWLKTFYDDRWPVRILGTSSATAALARGGTESGIGRWEERYLSPWLFSEYLELRGRDLKAEAKASLADTLEHLIESRPSQTGLEHELQRFLVVGGFPELLLAAASDEASEVLRSQRILRSDAVQRAIYRDIPQAFGIGEPMKLERFLYTLAGQMTGLLSPTKLASDLEMGAPTVDRYLSFLEQTFLVFTLPNYAPSEAKVQRRGRKLYFVDGAVRNAALERGLGPLDNSDEYGVLVENAAGSHLHALSMVEQVRLYHWRENKLEVDFVYDDRIAPLACEVTSSRRHSLRGLKAFGDKYPRFAKGLYLIGPTETPRTPAQCEDGVGRVSVEVFLMAVGLRAQAALA